MDHVEPPEERHLVSNHVREPEDQVADRHAEHQQHEHGDLARPIDHEESRVVGEKVTQRLCCRRHQDDGHRAMQHEVERVEHDRRAESPLLGSGGKEPLEREDAGDEHQ